MAYITEDKLRQELRSKVKGSTQVRIAEEIGVGASALSMALGGAPVTGKILAWLGYRRVRTRLYERSK
jgi:DNA transposition AAA+ family ATPase